MIRITSEPFDAADELRAFMETAGEGAVASFIGIVRGVDGIEALILDHYPGFTEKQVAALVDRLVDRHRLAAAMLTEARNDAEPIISAREEEVLQLVADGFGTTEIADKLYISQKTVKNHLASIYQKLDARDRTQAVLQAVRMGIVRLD